MKVWKMSREEMYECLHCKKISEWSVERCNFSSLSCPHCREVFVLKALPIAKRVESELPEGPWSRSNPCNITAADGTIVCVLPVNTECDCYENNYKADAIAKAILQLPDLLEKKGWSLYLQAETAKLINMINCGVAWTRIKVAANELLDKLGV